MRGSGWLPAGCLLMSQGLAAAEPVVVAPPPPELLEFLGSWETDDGRWLDPFELDDVRQAHAAGKEDRNDEE